jgi:hypothetical protein
MDDAVIQNVRFLLQPQHLVVILFADFTTS